MIKRAFFVIAVVCSISLPLVGQETQTYTSNDLRITGEVDIAPALDLYRPDLFDSADGASLIHGLPVLTLLDGRRFPISSELGGMGLRPLDLFPVAFLHAVEVQPVGPSLRYGSDATGGVVDLQLNRLRTGGEAGVFYGRSGGKYGREDYQAYIIGSVGTDKVNFTAGASYQETSFRHR